MYFKLSLHLRLWIVKHVDIQDKVSCSRECWWLCGQTCHSSSSHVASSVQHWAEWMVAQARREIVDWQNVLIHFNKSRDKVISSRCCAGAEYSCTRHKHQRSIQSAQPIWHSPDRLCRRQSHKKPGTVHSLNSQICSHRHTSNLVITRLKHCLCLCLNLGGLRQKGRNPGNRIIFWICQCKTFWEWKG